MEIEDKFAFIGSDIFRFKRSTDASFFIFDVSLSIQKASSEITSAHSKRFWKCEKIHKKLKMQLIYDITLKLLLCKNYNDMIILHQTGYVSTIKLSLFSGAMSFKSMKYIHQPTMHSSR